MHIPPQPGPGWRFNPPPGWPIPPEGWTPGVAWSGPEEDWPVAPPYWDWWVQESTAPAPVPRRRRLLLASLAAVAAIAAIAVAVIQLTEPNQELAPVVSSATSGTDTEPEPTLSPPPPDGGAYRDAREIMTEIEQAYGKTCEYVTYGSVTVNGQRFGMDTFATCQLGLAYAKIHVFPMPVNQFAWQVVFRSCMRGDYVILYGKNWIIDATGADQFGLAAHELLGGQTKVA